MIDTLLICSVEDPEDQGLGQEPVLSNGDQVEEKPAANEDAIARLSCVIWWSPKMKNCSIDK